MSNNPQYLSGGIRNRKLPKGLFGLLLGIFFLSSGIHYGFIVLGETYNYHAVVKVLIPIIYWISVSVSMTLFIRRMIRKTYEEPLQSLAAATSRVASGDFSVCVEPMHTPNKFDCLDSVILDFNRMVSELSGIETMKTDFISNVSHEFKTPIAVIQSNAEYLKATSLTDTQSKCAEAIYLSAKSLSSLVTNVLKLSKLENQCILPATENYDVCAQLAKCAADIEGILEKHGVALEAEMEDSALINADPTLMELVWNNLLSNAVKFTKKGSVTIKQQSDEDNIYISVIDTGCGMSEETLEKIFDKFYQGDTSHGAAGNGLGLSLVRRVISLHGFRIEVESEEGVGSKFTVIIPK